METFPLDATTIETALEEVGLTWKITSSEEWGKGRILYELCGTDEKGIATISSIGDGETRVLQINFFSSTAIDSSLAESEWEKAIRLATLLYGGFEDVEQVYRVFQDTYDEIAVIDDIPGTNSKDQKRIRWKNKMNDINCFVGFSQTGLNTETPETEIVSIFFSNTD